MLTSVMKFAGTSIVLGKERGVVFTEGTLAFESITYQEAMVILEALMLLPATVHTTSLMEKPTASSQNGTHEAAKKATPLKAVKKTKPDETPKAEPAATADVPAKDDPVVQVYSPPIGDTGPTSTAESEQVPAKADPPVATNGHSANGSSEVPEELLKAAKLRDVLVYLLEHGCLTSDDLVQRCKSVKDHVPVLQRITDLDDRVKRAAAALGV